MARGGRGGKGESDKAVVKDTIRYTFNGILKRFSVYYTHIPSGPTNQLPIAEISWAFSSLPNEWNHGFPITRIVFKLAMIPLVMLVETSEKNEEDHKSRTW